MDRTTTDLILRIADRGVGMAYAYGNPDITHLDVMVAVSLVHEKTPLRLRELLDSDDGNFGHDVFGILRHIDEKTGDLCNGFRPRFTDYEKALEARQG